ncbi:MAG TPA: HEAT repeat domain-containing protein, partial [Bryobacteraceae bacterium]
MKIALMLTAFASAAAATDATQCYGLLQHALDAKNPDTRKSAVVASSLVANDSPLILRLADMLEDKDVQVRVAVVTTLAEVKTPIATSALRRALKDKVPEVSFAAAKALYATGDPDGKAALLSVMEGDTKASSGFFTAEKREALRM